MTQLFWTLASSDQLLKKKMKRKHLLSWIWSSSP